jgi:hypothetical protein
LHRGAFRSDCSMSMAFRGAPTGSLATGGHAQSAGYRRSRCLTAGLRPLGSSDIARRARPGRPSASCASTDKVTDNSILTQRAARARDGRAYLAATHGPRMQPDRVYSGCTKPGQHGGNFARRRTSTGRRRDGRWHRPRRKAAGSRDPSIAPSVRWRHQGPRHRLCFPYKASTRAARGKRWAAWSASRCHGSGEPRRDRHSGRRPPLRAGMGAGRARTLAPPG